MKIKVITDFKEGIKMPSYATKGSAGIDLCSNIDDFQIKPGETKLVQTGIKVKIPTGYEIQIRSRSGLSLKNGIIVLNSPGTIDSDYTGEIGVILHNVGDRVHSIETGARIAQAVLIKHEVIEWEKVDNLEDTERGSGGFGSTGLL